MASGRRIAGTILIILAVLLTVGFGALVYDQTGGSNVLGLDADLAGYIMAGVLGAIVVVLFLLIVVHHRARRARRIAAQTVAAEPLPEAEVEFTEVAPSTPLAKAAASEPDAGEPSGPEVVVYDLPQVQAAYRSFERADGAATFTYPRTVASAVYTNDHLDVGNQHVKVRTLLAGPADVGPIPDDQAAPVPLSLGPDDVPEPYRSRLFRAPKASKISPTGKAADGDAFVAKLAEARTAAKPKPRAGPSYYGYSGDVHPVEDIEGIGAIYGDKLRKAGVYTTDRLCYEKPQTLADKVGVPRKTAETWQHMAELVKIKGVGPQYAEAMARAGIRGIADLKRRSAAGIADQVTGYLDSLNATVVGTAVTEARVANWQKAAARMKRVRLKVPEQ